MIHKLILRKFKRFDEETFLFNNFDLIVGINNSGKSTILQALAIWQYCVDQFRVSGKKGKKGIQILQPSFTALPVPEFNLLWKDRTDRKYEDNPNEPGKKDQQYIPIEIDVYWKTNNGDECNFCVQLSYGSPGTLYARPRDGWPVFNDVKTEDMPHVIYVPPFSGLSTSEIRFDDGNVRQSIGQAQPGSVLRNLLLRVENDNWDEIEKLISEWFNVDLQKPKYDPAFDTKITVEYKDKLSKKAFDIISGGSGFHQILTLLAFIYGWKQTTTILFDEPDAHLNVYLQRKILDYLKQHSQIQFLIATHSEEFIKSVEFDSIMSILSGKPERVKSSSAIIAAMGDVENMDVVRTQSWPYILYLEGEDDGRILSAWADTLNKSDLYQKFHLYFLRGSTKRDMIQRADTHYGALQKFVPGLQRAILLDYDGDDVAINPPADQFVCNEWKRKNIDNYLLVPDAWKRAVEKNGDIKGLFMVPYIDVVDSFFANKGLVLTADSSWKDIRIPGFDSADGKKLLFKNPDSLFEQIKNVNNAQLIINRSMIAAAMTQEEIHNDIVQFFDNLSKIVESDGDGIEN